MLSVTFIISCFFKVLSLFWQDFTLQIRAWPIWDFWAHGDINITEQENSDICYIGQYRLNVVTEYLWQRHVEEAGHLEF